MAKRGRRRARRPVSVWKLVLADLALFAVALVVFALFHHVLPRKGVAVGVTSERVSTVARSTVAPVAETAAPEYTPTPAATPERTPEPAAPTEVVVSLPSAAATAEATASPSPAPTPEPTMEALATPEPVGYFGGIFADKFSDGDPEVSGKNYRSANLNISLSRKIAAGSRCFVADIYIRDISCFQTVFARDTYGRGYGEYPQMMAKRLRSVVLINGDYYGTHNNGVVIRNGTLYRDDPNTEWDVGVLYWDGTFETFTPKSFNAEAEMKRGAYQAWNFGPLLLDSDGKPMKKFNSRVGGYCNPRTALGYYEPGHYCFVVVDGRSSVSRGMTMDELSQFMYELGCKRAYNLDGGRSSAMVAMPKVVNSPFRGGRAVSDALVIVEPKGE